MTNQTGRAQGVKHSTESHSEWVSGLVTTVTKPETALHIQNDAPGIIIEGL